MIKNVLIILSFFISYSSFSQTYEFAPVGAKWHYIASPNSGLPTPDYIFTVEVVKDTIIEGKLCKKLNDATLLYQNVNDSIFVYVKDDGFKLLYDLTKNAGEIFLSEYCSEAEVSVESVSSININGGDRKVQEYYANSLGCPFYGDVVEGIGYLNGYLTPSGDFMTTYWLQCYEDPIIGTFSFNSDACGVLDVKENELPAFSVYPTLFDNEIEIKNSSKNNNLHVHIFNSLGQMVYSSPLLEKTINTSNFSIGIYLVKITESNSNRALISTKVLKP